MRRSLRYECAVVVIGAALACRADRVAAQPPGFRLRLDSLVTTLADDQRMMGSITIRKGHRVLYQRTIGYRDSTVAGWVRADGDTR